MRILNKSANFNAVNGKQDVKSEREPEDLYGLVRAMHLIN
jgi:hypothetical protein